MAHQPSAIEADIPPYAIALAQRARTGRLSVYAGAGLSLAEPAGLPSGAQVAREIHARLRGAFPVLDGVAPSDLVAIADAIAGLRGGEEALRLTAVQVAEFTTAAPTYGQYILALLLLEGVLDILTTNWDNCVERAGFGERVLSIVSEQDLRRFTGRSVLKIHGCATQPESLLLTSHHLETPPHWVTDETRARLGNSVVVFVGIGDVAAYVGARLKEAIDIIGTVDNIRVVSPDIITRWLDSEWSKLVPNLADEHRVAATADHFLEKLGSAYVHLTLADLSAGLRNEPAWAAAFGEAADGLRKHDALTVLAWARRTGVVAKSGESILGKESMAEAIAALGKLAGHDFKITRDSTLDTSCGHFEILVSVGAISASRMRREAENRLEQHRTRGVAEPTFLVGGGMGWNSAANGMPRDIVGEGEAEDILDGPMNVAPIILRANDVLAA